MLVHIIDPSGKETSLRDPQDLLGEGGEAQVFSCEYKGQKLAAKIYKPGILGNKKAKLNELVSKAPLFPQNVKVPKGFVYDQNGEVIGTVADLADGDDVIHLCQIDWKEKNGLDNNFTNELFKGIHQTVGGLHKIGVTVGDLNYNNWKFIASNASQHSVMDVDSMGIGSFPCATLHPLFFDPRNTELVEQYGIAAGKVGHKFTLTTPPLINAETDWYSYTVMLTWALMTINPWQGNLPGWANEFKRMADRKSIFSPNVRIPKIVVQPDCLDDDLVHHLVQVYEKDKRGVFPLNLLKPWHSCTSCGTSFNRRICPQCSTGVKGATAVSVSGTCTMRVILSLIGKRLLAHKYQDRLRYLYEEGGILINEDGKKMIRHVPAVDQRFSTSMGNAYIGVNQTVYSVDQKSDILQFSTYGMGRLPVFDVNSGGVYHILGNKLTGPEGPIGDVTPGKTWFSVGEKLGFGFIKFGQGLYYFLFHPGTRGIKQLNHIPNPKGKLIDWSVVYCSSAPLILFMMASELNGQKIHEMYLIDNEGKVLGYMNGDPTQNRMLASIQGKAIWNAKLILTTTDEGVLSISPEGGTFMEKKLFSDTAKFVKAGNPLYIANQGKEVIVVGGKEILSLTI